MPETQETYYEESNKDLAFKETQETNLNESQDFRLIDSEGDESISKMQPLKDEDISLKALSDKQADLQQTSSTPRTETDNKLINDEKGKSTGDKELTENDPAKVTKEDVPGVGRNSEDKAELSDDEDEVIQGTPPEKYTPTKKTFGDIENISLKRKITSVDESPPAKVLRTIPPTDDVRERFENEESQQSCKSNDSYEKLFKDIRPNVVIEETQDPGNDFTQNSLKSSVAHAETTDAREHQSEEQLSQRQDKIEESRDTDKNENLNVNVSVNFTDTSANDTTLTNGSSLRETDAQMGETDLSIEETDIASSSTIVGEKSGTDMGETDGFLSEGNAGAERTKVADDERVLQEQESTRASSEVQPTVKAASSYKPRMSVEVIYEGVSRAGKDKAAPELVEIDEDGEKIVLDSSVEITYDEQTKKIKPSQLVEINDSHEDNGKIVEGRLEVSSEVTTVDSKSYDHNSASSKTLETTKESSLNSRSDRLVNGSSESKKYLDTDATLSVDSDTFCDTSTIFSRDDSALPDSRKHKLIKFSSFEPTSSKPIELISVSDNEHDVSANADDSTKNRSVDLANSNTLKTTQVEKEFGVYVKIKCVVQVDDNTKELLSKELTAVHCESAMVEPALRTTQKYDMECLADVSDNKESSPGSVNSNTQLFPLNPRLSTISSISSSSASSAASLAIKQTLKDNCQFSLPRAPAKHAKKDHLQPFSLTLSDKSSLEDFRYESLTREWHNHRLLITTILSHVNADLNATDSCNVSQDQLDDMRHMKSSTPEFTATHAELAVTPTSTKEGKGVKRARAGIVKSSARTNGETQNETPPARVTSDDRSPRRKKIRTDADDVAENAKTPSIGHTGILANSSPLPVDDLIGRTVFAKWSDNNYYPGIVTERLKTKYKVEFYDDNSKVLIPEFIIPIPKVLRKGLSVYVQTTDYGIFGMIVDVKNASDDDTDGTVYYVVETDKNDKLSVEVKDLFFTSDQAKMLKEDCENCKSLPTTPRHLEKVSLENMVDGKRRSKRIGGTPLSYSASKRKNVSISSASKSEPSGSGVKSKRNRALSREESLSTSDSNIDLDAQDELVLRGVQKEIIGTPFEQNTKGPQNRIKGKPRSKKKVEDAGTIAKLGPIPPTNSDIFAGMSFMLACAPLATLGRYLHRKDSSASDTEEETENEDDWTERPFVRDRLRTQIIAGGGKLYENFEEIPKDEYKVTKLITNVPNTTMKGILCLSVGIPAYNHKWIIRCCLEVNSKMGVSGIVCF